MQKHMCFQFCLPLKVSFLTPQVVECSKSFRCFFFIFDPFNYLTLFENSRFTQMIVSYCKNMHWKFVLRTRTERHTGSANEVLIVFSFLSRTVTKCHKNYSALKCAYFLFFYGKKIKGAISWVATSGSSIFCKYLRTIPLP